MRASFAFGIGNYKISASGFSAARYRVARFFIGGAAAFGFALIPELLALGNRQLQLDAAVLEVHPGGDEGLSLLLDGSVQFEKLGPVNQQLARALRIVIELRARRIHTNMRVQKKQFAILNKAIGIFQISLS